MTMFIFCMLGTFLLAEGYKDTDYIFQKNTENVSPLQKGEKALMKSKVWVLFFLTVVGVGGLCIKKRLARFRSQKLKSYKVQVDN